MIVSFGTFTTPRDSTLSKTQEVFCKKPSSGNQVFSYVLLAKWLRFCFSFHANHIFLRHLTSKGSALIV